MKWEKINDHGGCSALNVNNGTTLDVSRLLKRRLRNMILHALNVLKFNSLHFHYIL